MVYTTTRNEEGHTTGWWQCDICSERFIPALALDAFACEREAAVWEEAAAILERGADEPATAIDSDVLLAQNGIKLALRLLAREFRARAAEARRKG